MAVNIQKQMEDAWYDLITQIDFGNDDPQVTTWRAGDTAVSYPAVVVQVAETNSSDNRLGLSLWELVLAFLTMTDVRDDPGQSSLNNIHDTMFRFVNTVDIDLIENKLTDITVQGVQFDGTTPLMDDPEQRQVINMRMQIAAELDTVYPATSTTTTTTTSTTSTTTTTTTT